MMRFVRRLVRMVKVTVYYIFQGTYVGLSNRGEGWDVIRRAAGHTRGWARRTAALINLKVHVHGDPGRFSGGLVVSNHLSYLDIIVCASLFDIRFASQVEARSWPLFGPLIRLNRPVWIDRKVRRKAGEAEQEMTETMRRRISMLVYPEGTTTDGKDGLLPFKSTVFQSAAEAAVPIQPMLIFYSCTPKDGGPVAWFGDTALVKHIRRVLGLKEINAEVYLLPVMQVSAGESRKELAQRVHDVMESEYRRVFHERS